MISIEISGQENNSSGPSQYRIKYVYLLVYRYNSGKGTTTARICWSITIHPNTELNLDIYWFLEKILAKKATALVHLLTIIHPKTE